MTRRQLIQYVGPLWRQPTEAEWEDLEDRIERDVRPKMPAQIPDDAHTMGLRPAMDAMLNWRRDHKLLDTDSPFYQGGRS